MDNYVQGEPRPAAPRLSLSTIRGWIKDYLAAKVADGVTQATLAHYRKALNGYARWFKDTQQPPALNASAVFGFLEHEMQRLSEGSVRRRGEFLLGFCNWLVSQDLLPLAEADLIARTKNALINGVDLVADGPATSKVPASLHAERTLPPLRVTDLAHALDQYVNDQVAHGYAADIPKARLHWFLRWVRYTFPAADAALTADDFLVFGNWLNTIRSSRQNRPLGEPLQREILKRLRSVLRWGQRKGHLAHNYASWVPRLVEPASGVLDSFDDHELEEPREQTRSGARAVSRVTTADLRVWLELFFTTKRALGLSPRTLTWYNDQIAYFLRWVDEHQGLGPLDAMALESYLAARRSELSPHSLHCSYRAFHAFCAWLIKRRYIAATESPFTDVDAPRLPSKRMKYVTVEEYTQIFDAIQGEAWTDHRDRLLFAILFYSGLRAGEIVGMRVADIELKMGVIHVKIAKGNKERVVPYHPTVPGLLKRYLATRPRYGDGSTLFLSARGLHDAQPMPYAGLSQMLRRRAKRARLKLRLHAFRHGFAMWALNNGVPMSALASMMGHHSVTITEATYARWVTSAINREYSTALQRLEQESHQGD